MENFTLYDLNEYIRRVVALNFTEPIWVSCEITQCKDSRGNLYLDLVDKDELTQKNRATANAVIWYKTHLFLKNKLGELLPAILKEGVHVLFKVRVEFHEVYGLKLVIEDVDPAYTLGLMELERQKTIERLKAERLHHLNAGLSLPLVMQRVCVISSQTAAGYADFIHQLADNAYGYDIQYELKHVAVQGSKMEEEVCRALMDVDRRHEEFDCIVIIRGGGSRMDLAGFDNYEIAVRIARSRLPVFTGIGHEVDDTVADMVSHTALKTPTAVASYIIEHNARFEGALQESAMRIERSVRQTLDHHKNLADLNKQKIIAAYRSRIGESRLKLEQQISRLNFALQSSLKNIASKIDFAEHLIQSSTPEYYLNKGLAIIEKDGKIIRDLASLEKDDAINIVGAKVELLSTINEKKVKDE